MTSPFKTTQVHIQNITVIVIIINHKSGNILSKGSSWYLSAHVKGCEKLNYFIFILDIFIMHMCLITNMLLLNFFAQGENYIKFSKKLDNITIITGSRNSEDKLLKFLHKYKCLPFICFLEVDGSEWSLDRSDTDALAESLDIPESRWLMMGSFCSSNSCHIFQRVKMHNTLYS